MLIAEYTILIFPRFTFSCVVIKSSPVMPVGLHSSIQIYIYIYIYIHAYNIHHEPICWPSQNATCIPMVWGRHFVIFTCYCIKLYIYIYIINSSPFLCHHYIPNRSSNFLFRSKLCFGCFHTGWAAMKPQCLLRKKGRYECFARRSNHIEWFAGKATL